MVVHLLPTASCPETRFSVLQWRALACSPRPSQCSAPLSCCNSYRRGTGSRALPAASLQSSRGQQQDSASRHTLSTPSSFVVHVASASLRPTVPPTVLSNQCSSNCDQLAEVPEGLDWDSNGFLNVRLNSNYLRIINGIMYHNSSENGNILYKEIFTNVKINIFRI